MTANVKQITASSTNTKATFCFCPLPTACWLFSLPFLLLSSSTVNTLARCCAPATASSALPHIFSTLSSFQSDTRAIYLFDFHSDCFVKIFSQLVVRSLRLLLHEWNPDQSAKPARDNHTAVVTNFNLGSINNRFRRTAIAPLVIQ